MTSFTTYDADAIRARLDYPGCIAAVRQAMVGLSGAGRLQPLREIVEVAPSKLFALMPGMLQEGEGFGAKIITAYGDPDRPGRSAHRGVVILFDPVSGEVAAIGDAGEITHIRTACASAVATDALARSDARTLGLFGCGALAKSHLRAIPLVRDVRHVLLWSRDEARGRRFAAEQSAMTGLDIRFTADPREAAACDILCTLTGAAEPILSGDWLSPGTHVNLVGSSHAGPVEVDPTLVVRSRYIADSRRSVLSAGAEFLNARAMGLISDDHIAAEIGEVLLGHADGRSDEKTITVYKSLGHIVQDLAALAYIHGATCARNIS